MTTTGKDHGEKIVDSRQRRLRGTWRSLQEEKKVAANDDDDDDSLE